MRPTRPSPTAAVLLTIALALLLGACAGGAAGGAARAQPPPLVHVPQLDLERFLGKWYVVANIPYALERGAVGTSITYAAREDGGLDLRLSYHPGDFGAPLEHRDGVARIVDAESRARWQVDFGRRFRSDYVIVYVDPEYRYAAIGEPTRHHAWILAREVYLSDAAYATLLQKLHEQDYYTERLLRVPLRPEFMNVPGFQSP